jgi:hypothetical protein
MHCIEPSSINKDCPASQEWIPSTPPLTPDLLFKPLQHPFPECPFYRFGFQNFLLATMPNPAVQDANGNNEAAIVTYATIDDAFVADPLNALAPGALAPAGAHRGTPQRAWLGAIRQAGVRQIAFDQYGHTLYYGLQLNQAFVDFIQSTMVTLPDKTSTTLATLAGVRNADPNLILPSGLVEFKDAWIDIDPLDGIPQADHDNFVANYVTTSAWVPTLAIQGGRVTEDPNVPRQRQVALVAMHVVYTIPGHPEFVWASFQHMDSNGNPDTAGVAQHLPKAADPNNQTLDLDVCPTATDGTAPASYLLCKADAKANDPGVNIALDESKLVLGAKGTPDEQTFFIANANGTASNVKAQTSVYRMFPGSKSNSDNVDDDVSSLDSNIQVAWQIAQATNSSAIDPNDRRMNYTLVGANWMDKPAAFDTNLPFQNNIPDPSLKNTDPLQAYTDPLLHSLDPSTGLYTVPPTGPMPPPGPAEQADDRAAIWAAGGLQAAVQDLIFNGTDSPFSILGGEERMSSTAMETFTQNPSSFFNCFQCHNTMAITTNGVPTLRDTNPNPITLVDAKRINVSHMFSQFVLEQCTDSETTLKPAGKLPAACPQH